MHQNKKKQTWGAVIGGHCLALLFCVLFPGFVTAIAPVSWLHFQREGERVRARAQTCLFFVVPYRTATIDPVVGIGDRFVRGRPTSRRPGESHRRSEDEAFLAIHGEERTVEAPVTPFNIKSVTQRAQEFLADSRAAELRMTVVANWKFSVLAGGLVSLLTVLYIVGIVMAFVNLLRRLAGFGPPPEPAAFNAADEADEQK